MIEIYELPQGKITICFCDETISIGLLELNPNQELPKHNRSVMEELVQVYGSCVMKIFQKDKIAQEVRLTEGKKLEIPANVFHMHSNPTNEKSITLWKFEGNIVDVIENIRNNSKRIL